MDALKEQIREKLVATTLEHTHPHSEFWKGWNKAIKEILKLVGDLEKTHMILAREELQEQQREIAQKYREAVLKKDNTKASYLEGYFDRIEEVW